MCSQLLLSAGGNAVQIQSPEDCRTSCGLKWQISWAGTSIPSHFAALSFSSKWTALRGKEKAQELPDLD